MRDRGVWFVIIGIVLLAAITFPPGLRVINRIEPWILGLPFFQFSLIVVSVLCCIMLVIAFYLDDKGEEKQ